MNEQSTIVDRENLAATARVLIAGCLCASASLLYEDDKLV